MTLSYAKVYFSAEEITNLLEESDSLGDVAYNFNTAAEEKSRNPEKNITGQAATILSLIERYGMIGGEHHKQWILDQIVRTIYKDTDGYATWVSMMNDPDYMPWDKGIAP